jgi:hypothetical protein
MRTLPPESLKKVQELLEQVALMDVKELSEFRYLLGKDLGLHHLNTDLDTDPPGDTPAGVPRNPKAPVLTGSAKAMLDSL